MTVALRPPLDDLYQALGVGRSASPDELAAAFRARAKELHPDTRPHDRVAAERFKRVSLAYAVLRDPLQRARYDAGIVVVEPPLPAPSSTHWASTHWASTHWASTHSGTRPAWRARWAFWGGLALVVLGIAAVAWVVSLQRHDADAARRRSPGPCHGRRGRR